jgi:hypothetical protein
MAEYFLDTNIFMYAAGKPHTYKEPCVTVLSVVATGNISAAVDTEVFQEIMYRYHHINLADKGADLAWSIVDIGLEVLPVTKKDIEISLYFYKEYIKKGISPRDIIHVATMLNNGIEKIISVDKHFDVIEEVDRIDPSDLC